MGFFKKLKKLVIGVGAQVAMRVKDRRKIANNVKTNNNINLMRSIVVELPKDRWKPGQARVTDHSGRTIFGPFPVYGKADNRTAEEKGNPTRSPIYKYGDTPSGSYRIVVAIPTGPRTRYGAHTYGSNGALVLEPTDGDALIAKINGRTGLMFHAGEPGPQGGLRATHGCIRVSNEDMEKLMNVLSHDPVRMTCNVINAEVVVNADVEPVCGENAGDPPIGIDEIILQNPPPPHPSTPPIKPPPPRMVHRKKPHIGRGRRVGEIGAGEAQRDIREAREKSDKPAREKPDKPAREKPDKPAREKPDKPDKPGGDGPDIVLP